MTLPFPLQLDLYQVVISLSEATDLVSRPLVNHHRQVSAIAHRLGRMLNLPDEDLRDLAIAGALHDIGGLSLADRLETLDFEMRNPQYHADAGAVLLGMYTPFARIADVVRYHHLYWENGAGRTCHTLPVPRLSHVLHLADRIAVLIDPGREILDQADLIVGRIRGNAGRMFMPEMVDAFREVANRESFWLEVAEPAGCPIPAGELPLGRVTMIWEQLQELAALLARLIDFRSSFTSTHSRGVAAVAMAMAGKAGFDERTLGIAGLLHDIGKLVVPREILEKRKPLNHGDFIYIRRHPYYSRRILQSVPQFSAIAEWSAYHHERLDGSGYPFHIKREEIPAEARLLTVVDTFTALTEERPYRASLDSGNTMEILRSMARSGKLDGELVLTLDRHIEEMNGIRQAAQDQAKSDHHRFLEGLHARGILS